MNAATQANTEAQTTENKAKSENFKVKYDEVLSAQGLQPGAKDLSEAILDILLAERVPAGFGDINSQIAEAAKKNDVDTILELSLKLKNLKDNETANVKALADLKKKHTFADVLQAFSAEFEELAYKVSHKTITTTHALITNASKPKTTRRSKVESDDGESEGEKAKRKNKSSIYKITKADGTVIDFPIVMGADGNTNYKKAEEAYKALGFEVHQDAETKEYSIEPGTIELKDGSNVMVSRTNMIEAIEKQTAAMFDGWTAKKVQID